MSATPRMPEVTLRMVEPTRFWNSSAPLAKQSGAKRARYRFGAWGLRKQCSRNENGKEELQDR